MDGNSWSYMAASKQRAATAQRAESLARAYWKLGAAFAADVDAAYVNWDWESSKYQLVKEEDVFQLGKSSRWGD